MGIAAVVCALALVTGADAPFGQPEPEGLFKEPIPRYVEVQYDFLAPPAGITLPGVTGEMTPVVPPDGIVPVSAPPAEPMPLPPPPAESPTLPVESVPGVPPPPEPPMPPIQLSWGPAQVGGESFASLSLHPEGLQQATASFPAVMIRPVMGEWPRAFLLFRAGLADPIAPPEGEAKPTPLTLTVTYGESVIHAEEVTEQKWAFRAIDVTGYAGQMADLVFRASTMNPEERQSVLCLGEPALIEEQGIYYQRPGGRSLAFGISVSGFPRGKAGLAFAQVQCETAGTVELSLGDGSETHAVTPGTHWLPVAFTRPGRFTFKAGSGDAKFMRLDVAPYSPAPHFQKPEPTPPAP
ncbi:MAG: hypothetical protein RBU21_10685 [FCB group bacterium]|nr:hypothetical protein [FCB group bacterium]